MSRVVAAQFEGKQISRVYIAATTYEAKQIEEILTSEKIDYFIEIESFMAGALSGTPAQGAAFYVLAGQAQYCGRHLIDCGFPTGVTTED